MESERLKTQEGPIAPKQGSIIGAQSVFLLHPIWVKKVILPSGGRGGISQVSLFSIYPFVANFRPPLSLVFIFISVFRES
jgi:hypothetical protein